ncbi:hypothetical protein V3851_23855 [Paenibacillus sp. M1]|uniref:Uncharacterized protein n=1 Tax=Paenibacillus haidiansis TaxID=1574488 RepID=A0ABU7VZB8_9BACL
MARSLHEQHELVTGIAQKILGDIQMNAPDAELIVSTAHEAAMESFIEFLEEREKLLISELRKVTLEISAKIAATRQLRNEASRETGKQIAFRMVAADNQKGSANNET